MFKLKNIVLCILAVVMVLAMSFRITAANAAGNESTELPSPISFKCDAQLVKNAVLIDTINFELSESNPAITYTISETDSDLIFIFSDVSSSVNISLIVGDGSEHCVGFRGKSNEIYVQINPNLEYEFELSLGVICSDDMKHTEIVDYCSGNLEIYQLKR